MNNKKKYTILSFTFSLINILIIFDLLESKRILELVIYSLILSASIFYHVYFNNLAEGDKDNEKISKISKSR
jgi:hypothetical protein